MEAFWSGLLTVGLAELGDKTQLLAFALVRQFRRPLIVAMALALAFLVSYMIAGAVGGWIQQSSLFNWIRWLSAWMFIGIGCWMIWVADQQEPALNVRSVSAWSAFSLAFITVVIGELGDKSQLTVVALSFTLEAVWLIVAGALIGSLLVNLPLILIGRYSHRVSWIGPRPQCWMRNLAGGLFIVLGLLMLLTQMPGD